jgi:hypothetical protein
MTTQTSSNTLSKKVWIFVRFIVFGVGGFLFMMVFSVEFIQRALEHNLSLLPVPLNPFLSLALAIACAGLMLFGVGEWGRWAYLWVFLSIPLSLSALLLLPTSYLNDKVTAVLVTALPPIGIYLIVRRYYRHHDARRMRAAHDSGPTLTSDQESK